MLPLLANPLPPPFGLVLVGIASLVPRTLLTPEFWTDNQALTFATEDGADVKRRHAKLLDALAAAGGLDIFVVLLRYAANDENPDVVAWSAGTLLNCAAGRGADFAAELLKLAALNYAGRQSVTARPCRRVTGHLLNQTHTGPPSVPHHRPLEWKKSAAADLRWHI